MNESNAATHAGLVPWAAEAAIFTLRHVDVVAVANDDIVVQSRVDKAVLTMNGMLEVTKNAPQMAMIQLGTAFKIFFCGPRQVSDLQAQGLAGPGRAKLCVFPEHGRDMNAAINLRNMAVSSTASACGGKGAGPTRERRVKPAPMNQESSGKVHCE